MNVWQVDEQRDVIYRSLKFVDTLASIIAVISACINYFENEAFREATYDDQGKEIKLPYESSDSEHNQRIINIILVFVLCCLIVTHYLLRLKKIKYELKAKPHDTLITSGLYKMMCVELVICGTFNPPGVDYNFEGKMLGGKYKYSLDDICVVVSLCKCYLVLRLYFHFSRWTSDRIQMLAKAMRLKINMMFPFKCELKYRPFSFLLFVTFATVTFVSIVMRVVEM